jgi:hypothetical protein
MSQLMSRRQLSAVSIPFRALETATERSGGAGLSVVGRIAKGSLQHTDIIHGRHSGICVQTRSR